MTARKGIAALSLAAACALALLWLFRLGLEDETAGMIERRARRDFVEACNEAGASMGARARFRPQDVAVAQVEAEAGVAALVSVLEARRAGWRCRWNGADPATLARDAGPQ